MELETYKTLGAKSFWSTPMKQHSVKIRGFPQLSWEANSGQPIGGLPQCAQNRQGSVSSVWPCALQAAAVASSQISVGIKHWESENPHQEPPSLAHQEPSPLAHQEPSPLTRVRAGWRGQYSGPHMGYPGDPQNSRGWTSGRQKDLPLRVRTKPEKYNTDCYLSVKAPDVCGLANVGNKHRCR